MLHLTGPLQAAEAMNTKQPVHNTTVICVKHQAEAMNTKHPVHSAAVICVKHQVVMKDQTTNAL